MIALVAIGIMTGYTGIVTANVAKVVLKATVQPKLEISLVSEENEIYIVDTHSGDYYGRRQPFTGKLEVKSTSIDGVALTMVSQNNGRLFRWDGWEYEPVVSVDDMTPYDMNIAETAATNRQKKRAVPVSGVFETFIKAADNRLIKRSYDITIDFKEKEKEKIGRFRDLIIVELRDY